MKKQKNPPAVGRRIVALLFLVIALAISCLIGYAAVCARIVRVERTVLLARDLPKAFDGIKILYLSDIDIVGLTSPKGAARTILRLERLEPDMIILGGDYACDSLFDKLNSTGSEEERSQKRRALFSALKEFDAPLGKFAVAGENEAEAENLPAELALGGFTLLSDSDAWVEYSGARIAVVGLKDFSEGATDYGSIGARFSSADFVVVAAHNPASAAGVATAEASDSGAWCDLMLSGHNHGGQMVLLNRTLIRLTPREARYLKGWHKQSGAYLLVSEGFGCETVNLRLGTRAQAHLITLRAIEE